MVIRFSQIAIRDWRQFNFVEIDVHPRITIITGSNGSGKSTILNLFTQHFGISRPFLATPKRKKEGGYIYDQGLYHGIDHLLDEEDIERSTDAEDARATQARLPQGSFVEVGNILYDNGATSSIGFHDQQASSFGVTIQNQQPIVGVHIGSHRSVSAYQPVQNIPLQPMLPAQAYQTYFQEVMTRYAGGNSQFSPIYRMKEALIGMAAFGEGNKHLEPNAEVLRAFDGFIEKLRVVLPKEIGFETILIRVPDIVLRTSAGDFILDSSSGGVNAIIEITWQLFMFSLSNPYFAVTIDEPENHLHPSMQRSIIPNLLEAFPSAQFIIATHSPFVVSAVEDSNVYALNYTVGNDGERVEGEVQPRRRVLSTRLDQIHKAGSASEILREVLGVPVTTPDWAQIKIDKIVADYSNIPITTDSLNALRADMSKIGFAEFYPAALAKMVKIVDQA